MTTEVELVVYEAENTSLIRHGLKAKDGWQVTARNYWRFKDAVVVFGVSVWVIGCLQCYRNPVIMGTALTPFLTPITSNGSGRKTCTSLRR